MMMIAIMEPIIDTVSSSSHYFADTCIHLLIAAKMTEVLIDYITSGIKHVGVFHWLIELHGDYSSATSPTVLLL